MPKYDAVLVPHMYPQGKTDRDLYLARNAEFGPLLGVKNVHNRAVGMTGLDLVTAKADSPTYYFPKLHPTMSSQHQYEWKDRGDGVQFGTLIPDPLGPEASAKAIEEAVDLAREQVDAAEAANATA